ncbi:MAG TPA: gamma-glutamylcyclotransferase, partial [Alphaproteobacteria bacterium]|nr:gamma-glutamylcyclotransferase [Alphaproteobacteria bacterium]
MRLVNEVENWMFGFGSLMWRPDFVFAERAPATLYGRHRAFCIYSVHHRGTHERRGLVLGLARGGSTRGIAYRIDSAGWEEVRAYLKEREQPTETYVESRASVRVGEGRLVSALLYVSDRGHAQWAGALTLEQQADLIAGATGLSGRNVDYLRDLVLHLRDEGIKDREMEKLLLLVEERERISAQAG